LNYFIIDDKLEVDTMDDLKDIKKEVIKSNNLFDE
jgi:hypothetical protein